MPTLHLFTQSKTLAFSLYAGTRLSAEVQKVNKNLFLSTMVSESPGRDSDVNSKCPRSVISGVTEVFRSLDEGRRGPACFFLGLLSAFFLPTLESGSGMEERRGQGRLSVERSFS